MKAIAWDEPQSDLEANDLAAVRAWLPSDPVRTGAGSGEGGKALLSSGNGHRPTGHCIDWLAYTVPYEVGLQNAVFQNEALYIVGEPRRNLKGYDTTLTLSHGCIAYHSRFPEHGIHVLFTSSDLRDLMADGVTLIPILQHAISLEANVTRLDFAIDYFAPAAPDELHQAWLRRDLVAPGRKVRLDQDNERTKGVISSAFTVYIGSRASSRYLCVYDKAAETGLPGPWTRLELRCGEPYGRRLAVAMVKDGIADAGKQAIREFVRCTVPWFIDATSGPSVELPPIGEKQSDPLKWLLEFVLPIFVSTLKSEEANGHFNLRDKFVSALLGQSPKLRQGA